MKELPFHEKPNTQYAISHAQRDRQILSNCQRVKERVAGVAEELRTDAIAICGYGPSLKKTWQHIKKFKYVMTCSGAHPFLIKRKIVPNWHLAVDPLPNHTVDLMGTPHPDVEYLMASTVYPDVITHLQKHNAKVKLWHIFTSDDEGKRILPRGEWSFTGGIDAGLRCLVMARVLGFTDIHVFGLDGSTPFTNDCRHAGKHPTQGKGKEIFFTTFQGKKYLTTPGMLTAAQGVLSELDQLTDCKFKFYGSGLIQDMAASHTKKASEYGSLIAFEKPALISPEMRELNKELHLTNPNYGTSGERYVNEVKVILALPDVVTCLDYGCGRGTLQKALGVPIYEYDPCIDGKDMDAVPADLVACTDVLEHIEPDKLQYVLDDLARVTKKVGFFVIHLGEAKKTYSNGQNAHLLVKPPDWWTKQIRKYFKIESAEIKGKELHIIVGPKVAIVDPQKTVEFEGATAKFFVPNDTIEWRVNTLLKKEPATIEWLSKMKEGEVFYDIGANMGGYSVLGALKGAKVFAFEPEAQNYALLVRNLELNKFKASAYSIAVSDRTKLDTLHLSSRLAGGSCHSFGEDKDAFGVERNGFHPTQGCFGMPLDEVVKTLPRPDYIKIDVDGFEPKVIKGAKDTLTGVKSMLVEVNPALPEHIEMIAELEEMGFKYSQAQVESSTRKDGPFKGVAEYVFYRENETEKHILRQIEQAQVIEEPFPHFVIEDVLPQDAYDALMASLPKEYVPIEKVRKLKGYPQRFVGDLPRPEWTNCLQQPLLEKFGVVGTFTDETLLIKDLPKYEIGPHTDSTARILSAIMYLGDGKDGTVLYQSRNGFRCKGGPHYPAKDFDAIKVIPYKANSMFVFLKTDNSFHGVAKTKAERNILLYDIRRC